MNYKMFGLHRHVKHVMLRNNEVVDIVDKAFEKDKMQVAHIYPELLLDYLDLFKIVKYGRMVDEEDERIRKMLPPTEEENVPSLKASSIKEKE